MDGSGDLLVVIVDVNSAAWEAAAQGGNASGSGSAGGFGDVLQSITLFCNSHKMLNRSNECCLVAMGADTSSFISSTNHASDTGVLKPDTAAGLIDGLLSCYSSSSSSGDGADRAPEGQGSPPAPPHCALARGLSQAMCVINRHLQAHTEARCRILVIQASADLPESYNAVMNGIFR
jgi:hypothetical protein